MRLEMLRIALLGQLTSSVLDSYTLFSLDFGGL